MPCPCCFWSWKPQGLRVKTAGMNKTPPLAGPPWSRLRGRFCVPWLCFHGNFLGSTTAEGASPGDGPGSRMGCRAGHRARVVPLVEMRGKCGERAGTWTSTSIFYFSSTSRLLLFSCAGGISSPVFLPAPTQPLSPLCPTWAWRSCFSH